MIIAVWPLADYLDPGGVCTTGTTCIVQALPNTSCTGPDFATRYLASQNYADRHFCIVVDRDLLAGDTRFDGAKDREANNEITGCICTDGSCCAERDCDRATNFLAKRSRKDYLLTLSLLCLNMAAVIWFVRRRNDKSHDANGRRRCGCHYLYFPLELQKCFWSYSWYS